MKCERVERRLASEAHLTAEEHLHVLGCEGCRRYIELCRGVQSALPALVEPALAESFDALLAQRVLAEARQTTSVRPGFSWVPFPALGTAVRAGVGASVMAVGMLGLAHRMSDLQAWAEVLNVGLDSRTLLLAVLLLAGLLGAMWVERGRRWLVRWGLLAAPGVAEQSAAVPGANHRPVNPIYGRYLTLWRRTTGSVPAVLALCMAVAAPFGALHVPWLSVGLLLLWAVAQGLPRGYFTVSSEAHAGTFDLVRVTGLSPRETTQGYLLAALMPTAAELVAGAILMLSLASFGAVPVASALACILLAGTLALWATTAGMTLGRGTGRSIDGMLLSALALLGLSIAGVARAAAGAHVPAAGAWTSLALAAAALFGCLSVVLLQRFEHSWDRDLGAETSSVPAAPGRVLRLPSMGPFVSVALRTYLRAWERHGARQMMALAAVLLPLTIWGPERGMPATMLMFLLGGFAQAFKVMDRDQHRAIMALLQVTPMSSGRMFGGQLLTAVLPLGLPWALHCLLALWLAPQLSGPIVVVSALSVLLGLTGAALGLLNRYAVSIEFESPGV